MSLDHWLAFVTQFMATTSPFWPQVFILEATFITLATLNATLYALLASSARKSLREPRVRRAMNRTGGGLLIGAGLLAAGWRKVSV
jgi:threonine/homoserine/homoserine lactone efflux protein